MNRNAPNLHLISCLLLVAGPIGCSDIPPLQGNDAGADSAAAADGAANGEGRDAGPPGSCSGVSCYTPPANECAQGDDDAIAVYSPVGYCAQGECVYATRDEPCETGTCQGGACVDNPCQGLSCHTPPEVECSGPAMLTVYNPRGFCVEEENGANCGYAVSGLSCEQGCEEGACRDQPCAGVICNAPPARYCADDVLLVWHTDGYCAQGECIYSNEVIECTRGCSEGSCEGEEPCTWVSCDTPPASFCRGGKLRVFESQGVCDRGACSYSYQDIECTEGCEQGQCIGDPCAGISCKTPPARHCQDDELVVWDTIGRCDVGACDYNSQIVDCGSRRVDGACEGENPCAFMACDDSPPRFCVEDRKLRVFDNQGVCTDGVCS